MVTGVIIIWRRGLIASMIDLLYPTKFYRNMSLIHLSEGLSAVLNWAQLVFFR